MSITTISRPAIAAKWCPKTIHLLVRTKSLPSDWISEGVARAFVADLAPTELRGTAYGVYYCVVGLCTVVSGLVGGLVWDKFGPAATFYLGASLAFVAMLGMLVLMQEPVKAKV